MRHTLLDDMLLTLARFFITLLMSLEMIVKRK